MRRLIIFGDSYSNSWDNISKKHPSVSQNKYRTKFENENKRTPIHFSDIVNESLGCDEIINYSISGADNYTILEQIGNKIDTINNDDFVIVGWSDITRYRHIEKDVWMTNYVSDEILLEQGIKRNNSLIISELNSWQNILRKSIDNIFFWSPFYFSNIGNIPFVVNIKREESGTIAEETDGEIDDLHWGETGHIIIGNYLINKIKYNNLI